MSTLSSGGGRSSRRRNKKAPFPSDPDQATALQYVPVANEDTHDQQGRPMVVEQKKEAMTSADPAPSSSSSSATGEKTRRRGYLKTKKDSDGGILVLPPGSEGRPPSASPLGTPSGPTSPSTNPAYSMKLLTPLYLAEDDGKNNNSQFVSREGSTMSEEEVRAKVEEEVINKLARASMMGMLLKQHREQMAGGEEEKSAPSEGINRAFSNVSAQASFSDQSPSEPQEPDHVEQLEARLNHCLKRTYSSLEAENFPMGSTSALEARWNEISRLRDELIHEYWSHQGGDEEEEEEEEETGEIFPVSSQGISQAPKGAASRVWPLFYGEIQLLQPWIKSSRTRGGGGGKLLATCCERLERVIDEGVGVYEKMLDAGGTEVLRAIMSLGDLWRYRGTYLAKDFTGSAFREAEKRYTQAMDLSPQEGRAYNQMAVLAGYREETRDDLLLQTYYYFMALTSAQPFSARENILSLFQRARRRLHEMPAHPRGFMAMSAREHRERFILHFLLCVSACVTRIGLESEGEFEVHQEAMGRHLAVAMQKDRATAGPTGSRSFTQMATRAVVISICSVVYCRKRAGEDVNNAALDLLHVVVLRLIGHEVGAWGEEVWTDARCAAVLVFLEWVWCHRWGLPVTRRTRELTDALGRLQPLLPLCPAHLNESPLEEDWIIAGLNRVANVHRVREDEMTVRDRGLALSGRCRSRLKAMFEAGMIPKKGASATSSSSSSSSSSSANVPPPPPSSSTKGREKLKGTSFHGSNQEEEGVKGEEERAAARLPPPPPPFTTERLCPSCSNMVEGTACEFCGYDFNLTGEEGQHSQEDDDQSQGHIVGGAKGGGLLIGVKVPPPPASNRHARERERGGGGGGRFQGRGSSRSRGREMSSSGVNMNMREVVRGWRPQGMEEPSLVVIDAPNVAMRHGLNKSFSCRGVVLAVDFFRAAGHRVVCFLPDYYFDRQKAYELKKLQSLNMGSVVKASQLPDNIDLLKSLQEAGVVVGTPPQDYDDSYSIRYAQQHDAYVVTNDLYRDHLSKIEQRAEREEVRRWLKARCISYTFVGDEFLPNPDFKFGQDSSLIDNH